MMTEGTTYAKIGCKARHASPENVYFLGMRHFYGGIPNVLKFLL